MSVLQCNREGCRIILCTRYSSRFGYICDGCFEELQAWTKGIREFMETPKPYGHYESHRENWNAFLETEFIND